MSDPILELKNVSVMRGGIRVLTDVSLCVGDEIVGLIGLNASGKSTLLRTISGLLVPSDGSIKFQGQQIAGWHAYRVARSGLGYMPQSNQLVLQLSVLDNIRLGSYRAGHKVGFDTRLQHVVETLPNLPRLLHLHAGVLSGGERQLVALAKCLVNDPTLLMLDEPSAGLGPIAIDAMRESFKTLRNRSVPILIAEQNISLTLDLTDRVLILYNGSIFRDLPASELRHNRDQLDELLLGGFQSSFRNSA